MLDFRLYLAQRISAVAMVPFVFGHLVVIIYAIHDGLSAVEILSRTQGSLGWGLFYGLFVIAVSIHAAIGVRVIAFEHFKLSTITLNTLTWLIGVALLVTGARAVSAVVL